MNFDKVEKVSTKIYKKEHSRSFESLLKKKRKPEANYDTQTISKKHTSSKSNFHKPEQQEVC